MNLMICDGRLLGFIEGNLLFTIWDRKVSLNRHKGTKGYWVITTLENSWNMKASKQCYLCEELRRTTKERWTTLCCNIGKNWGICFQSAKIQWNCIVAKHHLGMINRSTLKNRKNNQTEGCRKCEKESAAWCFMSKENLINEQIEQKNQQFT